MTTSETVEPRAEAAASVSQRRLTIGICINVVAIAFEAIAVATAMPVAARELDGLAYYAWSFSLFVIGMLFATVVAGRLSDRIGPGPAAGHRDGDLRRRPAAGRVRATHAAADRRPAGPGTGQRPDEHRGLRPGRPGLLGHPAAPGVHLHLHGLDPAVVRRTAGVGLADRAAELALGLLRRGAAGGRRRAADPADPAPGEPVLDAGRGTTRTPPRPPRCGPPVSWPSRPPRSSWRASGSTGSPSVCWSPAWPAWSSDCPG